MTMRETSVVLSDAWRGDLLLQFLPAGEGDPPGALSKEIGELQFSPSGGAAGESGARVAQVSLGEKGRVERHTIRKAAMKAARWAYGRGFARVGIDGGGLAPLGIEGAGATALEGFLMGTFEYTRMKSDVPQGPIPALSLLIERPDPDLERRVSQIERIVASANMAREWAHEPPNVVNPVSLAERCRILADERGLKIQVFDEAELAEMGAGAILAVGMGSGTPPRLIILEWPGEPEAGDSPPTAVVGKTITFDTGGYSLKTRDGMLGMKYDKWGGMAVAGVMRAAADLGLKNRVIGVIAAAENALSERAYRPNDIVRTLSGKTVEVISTDAEGRLVLADALTYVERTYRPRAAIDLATLTGGVVVALGPYRAGLMSNDDALCQALSAAGERTHERLWRLPLDEDYFKLIKGYDSDLRNSGGRQAQPITAGMFLRQFVEPEIPWAHIDVAGVATVKEYKVHSPQRATGFGVRLLADYLLSLE
jgi:leucyl aminopeptidase